MQWVYRTSVDGEWSNWQSWGQCTASCENGTMTRQRTCDNPAPAYGGQNCSGTGQETKPCDTGKACPGLNILIKTIRYIIDSVQVQVHLFTLKTYYVTWGAEE